MKPPTKRQLSSWLNVAAALLLGFALRHWFIAHNAKLDGDSIIYGNIATNWMHYGVYGFVMSEGVAKPTLIRLPGYPLFLVACFRIFGVGSYVPVLYVQTVIDLLACLLVSTLAGRLFGARARIAALWLATLCPFTANYVATALTETLTLFCITLAFFALERWNARGRGFNYWLWIIAITLGYSILLRPEQGLLAAAILPTMLWLSLNREDGALKVPANQARVPHPLAASSREGGIGSANRARLIRAALPVFIAALCTLLPLVPWTIRNEHTFHVLQPLAPRYAVDPGEKVPLSFQRWYRTWAIEFASTEDVYWNYDGAPIQIADLPERAFDTKDSNDQYTRTEALLNEYNETSNNTPELEARFAALAQERIAAHPIRYYLALPLARVLNMTLRPRLEMLPLALDWWNWSDHHDQTAFAFAYATLNFMYLALAGFGIAVWHRRQWDGFAPFAWAMLSTILLRCALLLTLDNSEPRYTLEFFPILFLFASIVFMRRKRLTESSPSSSNSA